MRVELVVLHPGPPPPSSLCPRYHQPASPYTLLQERAEHRKESALCHSLLRGDACPFGDKCRFSHDVAAFLQRKGPELPGQCPFMSTGACAFGASHPHKLPHVSHFTTA